MSRWYSSGNAAQSERTASRMSWKRSGAVLSMAVEAERGEGSALGDLGAGLHRQRAVGAACPEREAALTSGLAAQRERMQVEQRAERLEVEAAHHRFGPFAPEQVEEQCRDQGAVDD